MAEFRISGRDFVRGRGVDVPTGEANVVVVEPFTHYLVEVEDAHFRTDSAVLMPDRVADAPSASGGTPASSGNRGPASAADRLVDGLRVVQVCLEYARDHRGHNLLVVGHTDRAGAPGYNLTLSRLRAENVLHVVTGDEESWAEVCCAKNQVADYQQILAWIAAAFGWDCDPGRIDNEVGPRTRGSVARFQREYNDLFDEDIAVDGVVGRQVWKAFFRLYMQELALMLGTDRDGLAALRGGLSFVEPKAIGCGASHPVGNAAANAGAYRSQADRRVELLFFKPGQEPRLSCHPSKTSCEPSSCELYDRVVYRFEPVPAPDAKLLLEIQLHDDTYEPLGSASATLVLDDASELAATADAGGWIRQEIPATTSAVQVKYVVPKLDAPVERTVTVHLRASADDVYRERLRVLGFARTDDDAATSILRFQIAHPKLQPTGVLDKATKAAIRAAMTNELDTELEGA